jgi:hypothetical protein
MIRPVVALRSDEPELVLREATMRAMDLDEGEIRRLVARGEGKELELKEGLPRDVKVARSLCALANTRGGLLLVGVTDKGSYKGAPRPRESMARLRGVAEERLEPPLAVQVGSVRVGEVTVVWCSVPLSPARPHAVLGEDGEREVVVRVGSSNRAATGATLAGIRPRVEGKGLEPLERKALAWVARRARAGGANSEGITVAGFARAHNVGLQRARRAFARLELAGRLVGHGSGARRVFGPV